MILIAEAMAMSSLALPFLSFLILATAFHLTSSQVCYGPGDVTANSTYNKNRRQAIAALQPDVIAKGGFRNTTAGHGADKVYAMAFCRPGAESESCSWCIRIFAPATWRNCSNNRKAYWWTGDAPCFISFSNRPILGRNELHPVKSFGNAKDLETNMRDFNKIWQGFMEDLAGRASRDSSSPKYAVETAKLSPTQDTYSMAMCIPGVSVDGCRSCLSEAAILLQQRYFGKQGGVMMLPSCLLRWDPYPFHAAFFNATEYNPSTPRKNRRSHSARTTEISVTSGTFAVALTLLACCCYWRMKRKQEKRNHEPDCEIETPASRKFLLKTIEIATDNFDEANMLGKGGFGVVYKGKLPNGRYVAVKRLDRNSRQGEREFANEVYFLTRLEHRNLVKLLGFCFEKGERLLVYEFIPNSSLDHYLFDSENRFQLSWEIRYKIIKGIIRGLLYLHEDSQLKIIHCDLKPSNILLESNMNPKIADFGIAKLCQADASHGQTRNPVGTYGYMAPEYLGEGRFSSKSDVYSFGMLVMELLSGQRSSEFCNGETPEQSLTAYGWKLWREGNSISKFFDPVIADTSHSDLMRCLHIGLLCVQANVANRPTVYSVVLMLEGHTVSLMAPSAPGYANWSEDEIISVASDERSRSGPTSINEVSISDLMPR